MNHYRIEKHGNTATCDLNTAAVLMYIRQGYTVTRIGPSSVTIIEETS